MWQSVDKNKILEDVNDCDDILYTKKDCYQFWNYIRIEPEKWQEQSMGTEGGGFWVVAIIGKTVIYYNDIEEGYNRSSFKKYGEIDNYYPGQTYLHEMVESLYKEISDKRNSH